jgi:hypothetical protein
VDFTDFALFAGLWNENTLCIDDLNIDGLVDLSDLKFLRTTGCGAVNNGTLFAPDK